MKCASIRNPTPKFPLRILHKNERKTAHSRQRPQHPTQQECYLLIASAIQSALFIPLAAWIRFHPLPPIDPAISYAVQKKHSRFLRDSAIVISTFNDHIFLNFIIAPIAYFLWKVRLRLEAVMVIIATIGTNVFRTLFQHLVNRPRPSPQLVQVMQKPSHSPSFPSGHVLATVTFWGWLIALKPLILRKAHGRQNALLSIPALIIAAVCPARIYLGDHWASDVLGGYLLAGSWLSFALHLYLKLKRKRVLANKQ